MLFRNLALLVLAGIMIPLAACSPARTGLVGNTLTSNTRPAISITANTPLQPVAGGRLWFDLPSPQIQSSATASFAYAVFSIPHNSGPVAVHAHAIISRLEDTNAWRFQHDSFKDPKALSFSSGIAHGGYGWTAQIMHTPARGDWFSELWVVNGRQVPEAWLAKRFAALLNDGNKAIFEYREPWPVNASMPAMDPLITDISGDALTSFSQRADKAFSVSAERGSFEGAPTAPSALPVLPDIIPNLLRLVGEVASTGNDGRDGDPN
jgi:hypothetical protein